MPNPAENDDEEQEEQELIQQEPEHESVNYTGSVKGLYNETNRKPVNKIQNALFVDKSVANVLNSLRTGEDAVSFFVKYGTLRPSSH